MAGDWIKIEHTLCDKPEVCQMAELLQIDPDAIVGKLVRFWSWCDQQTVSGNGLTVTKTFLDRITHQAGFADALLKVGWLTSRDNNGCLALSVPRFERHNGQTAKERANTNRRVAKSRECNANTVTNVTPEPLQKPLPEKRREEKSIELSTPLSLNNALELRVPPPPIEQPKPERERVLGEGAELSHWQELMKKVNGLKPAWGKPAHWNASEMHLLYGGSGAQMLEMTEEDWTMLTGYLRAPMNPEQKEFWLPRTRIKFVETFPQVLESADRWAKKHQPKSAETDDIYH